MSITVYSQSKAFIHLSRFHLLRFAATTGVCIGTYYIGRQLCSRSTTTTDKRYTYGAICKHYSKFCGTIAWSHVLVTCVGSLIYAREKSLPRAVFLQKGFVYGEKLGFGTLCVYGVTRELSSREWFAMSAAGAYDGLKYGLLQGHKGWQAYHSTRIGLYGGISIFVLYSICQCFLELWTIFKDPNLSYSAWENFDTEDYMWHRIGHFFNVTYWTAWFTNTQARDTVIRAKGEMKELQYLMDLAGLTKKDLVHVNLEKVSDVIFNVYETIQTGRREYDDMSVTTSTMMDVKMRQLDPAYHTQKESWETVQAGKMKL